jgi:hypothetical protein
MLMSKWLKIGDEPPEGGLPAKSRGGGSRSMYFCEEYTPGANERFEKGV